MYLHTINKINFFFNSMHCAKYAKICVFPDPYFPAEGQNLYAKIVVRKKPVFWNILHIDKHHKNFELALIQY